MRENVRRFWWVAALGFVLLFATVAAVGSGDGSAQANRPIEPATNLAAAPVAKPPAQETGKQLRDRGLAQLERSRRHDALASFERAVVLSPELVTDAALRTKVAGIVDTRDTVAAVIALDLLATRFGPGGRDLIVAQASNAKLAVVRHRALAIAERDGFADRIDRTESWSLDLTQAGTCDERKEAIAKLVTTHDRRAVPVLRRVRSQQSCVQREAAAAIAQLESGIP